MPDGREATAPGGPATARRAVAPVDGQPVPSSAGQRSRVRHRAAGADAHGHRHHRVRARVQLLAGHQPCQPERRAGRRRGGQPAWRRLHDPDQDRAGHQRAHRPQRDPGRQHPAHESQRHDRVRPEQLCPGRRHQLHHGRRDPHQRPVHLDRLGLPGEPAVQHPGRLSHDDPHPHHRGHHRRPGLIRNHLRTQLSAVMGMFGGGTSGTMDFTMRNAFRMEPQK